MGNAWGALTAHTPGIYEKAVAQGGYGATLVTVSSRQFEVYGFSYNSSGTKPQILWAGTSTNNATDPQVLCSTLSTTPQEIAGWISMSTVSKSSTYSMPSNTEFAASSVGSTGLYQMKMQGHSITLKFRGYDQFSFLGNDNNGDKSKGKYLQVTINGVDSTKEISSSTTIRRFSLSPSTEYTIVITGLGSSNEHIDAFSLRLPPAANYTVTIDPNGGSYASTPDGWTYDNVNDKYTKSIASGTSFSAPSGLSKGTDDLTWKNGSNNDVTFPVSITGDITFVAQWTPHEISSDASLSDLKVDGTTVTGFAAATTSYNVVLPFGTTVVPTVTATAADANAKSVVVTPATSLPGSTTVVVTAEDNSTETYTVNFSVSTTKDIILVFKTGTAACNGSPSVSSQILSNNSAVSTYINQITFTNVEGDGDNGAEGTSLNVGKKTGNMFTLAAKAGYALKAMTFKAKIQDANCEYSLDGGAWTTLTSTNTGGDACYDVFADEEVHEFRLRSTGTSGVWIRNMQLTILKACTPKTIAWVATPVEYEIGKSGQGVSATANNGTVSYATSDNTIIDVNASTGALTVKALGTVTLTASVPEGDGTTYCANGGSLITASASGVKSYYIVTFDPQNGSSTSSEKYYSGSSAISLPSAPEYSGHTFLGWFDAETGGTQITEAITPVASHTIYAHWVADCTGPTITTQPSNASYLTGRTATALVCEATAGDAGELTYAWYSCDDDQRTNPVSLGTSAPTPSTAATGTFYYYCVVTEAGCAVERTSNVATITVADKDPVEIIGVVTTGGTNKTVSGAFQGDASVNLDADKKISSGKYIYVTLADGYSYQETDVLVVDVAAKSNVGSKYMEVSTGVGNLDDGIWKTFTSSEYSAGENVIPLTGIPSGKTSIGLKRSDNQNTWTNGLKVYRVMNPLLKAITFNGVSGIVNETYKTVTVTLPEETTDLAALTIVPTIVRNAAHATTPEAVIGGSWAEGANTYRVMDKDGDYTDYTVTITLQGTAATPSITTQPASQAYCAGSEPTLTVEASVTDGGTLHYAWYKDDVATSSDVATCVVTGAGTYKVVVTNQKSGKFDASTTSSNAVITLNTPATITTQPSDLLKQIEGADITLSVVASNATGYQWYSCDDTEKTNAAVIPGKIAADYTFAATAGFFYCEVTGACGAVESNVARVTVKRSAGCQYITATSGSEATLVDGTKMYACGSDGKLATGDNFASASANVTGIDASAVGMINKQYFVVKFPVDVEEITVFGYNSSSRNVNNLCYGTSVGTDTKVNTAISTDDYVKTASNDGNERSMTIVFNEAFSKDKYLFIKFNSALEVYRICYTEALSKPVVPTLLNQDLCAGDAIAEIDATSTKTGDGTLSYQWYNADDSENPVAIEGASSAKYTPTTDGKYYVEVANGLIGRVSNKAKSNTITITHYAGTAITEELAAQRGNVDDVVTLEVAASGKNLHYEWKECATIDGSYTSVAGAADAASLNVTITEGMSKYYKVVVSSDCGADQESIAKVEQFVPVLLQNVTTSTTWDWTKAASVSEIKLTSSTSPKKNEGFVMANGAATIYNNSNFESDKLYLEGEYIIRTEGGKLFQGQTIKFNTTVAGMLRVKFSHTGSNKPARELYINGVATGDTRTQATGEWSRMIDVPAGEVCINAYHVDPADGAGLQYIRVYEIEFTHYNHKRTGHVGDLGTICWPYNVPVENRQGASFYTIEGSDASFVYFIEETGELEAGRPYIFELEAENLLIQNGETKVDDPVVDDANNGLHGTFVDMAPGSLTGNYVLVQGHVRVCGSGAYLNANRAYIVRGEVPGQPEPQPAPGRRRLMVGAERMNPTGVEDILINEDGAAKQMINGKLYIIRAGHIYDATGHLVK